MDSCFSTNLFFKEDASVRIELGLPVLFSAPISISPFTHPYEGKAWLIFNSIGHCLKMTRMNPTVTISLKKTLLVICRCLEAKSLSQTINNNLMKGINEQKKMGMKNSLFRFVFSIDSKIAPNVAQLYFLNKSKFYSLFDHKRQTTSRPNSAGWFDLTRFRIK